MRRSSPSSSKTPRAPSPRTRLPRECCARAVPNQKAPTRDWPPIATHRLRALLACPSVSLELYVLTTGKNMLCSLLLAPCSLLLAPCLPHAIWLLILISRAFAACWRSAGGFCRTAAARWQHRGGGAGRVPAQSRRSRQEDPAGVRRALPHGHNLALVAECCHRQPQAVHR